MFFCEISDLMMRTAFSVSLPVNSLESIILFLASSMFFTVMPVANTCGTFVPRSIYPLCSSADKAVLTRVSMSEPESSQPACRAISRAEQLMCGLVFVKLLTAFHTCCISLMLNFVWFRRMKCLSRSLSQYNTKHLAFRCGSLPARPASWT